MDQCPDLGSSTSEAQAWHPAGAPRPSWPRFMCFPSLAQLLPPRLPSFSLIFTSHTRWGAEGSAEDAKGQLPCCVLVRTPRQACWVPPSHGVGSAKTARPPDRPTDPVIEFWGVEASSKGIAFWFKVWTSKWLLCLWNLVFAPHAFKGTKIISEYTSYF